MKKFNLQFKKPDVGTAISFGLTALGVVQLLLSNKKDEADKAQLKAEIVEDVISKMSSKSN